jgi:hypothetical protein
MMKRESALEAETKLQINAAIVCDSTPAETAPASTYTANCQRG